MRRRLVTKLLLWALRLDAQWATKLMVGQLPFIESAKAMMEAEARGPMCCKPPAGWWCTRRDGHEGPCAAWPLPPGFRVEAL